MNINQNNGLTRGFIALYGGRTVTAIVMGLLGIFLPIFLYQLFDKNFALVLVYYGLSSLLFVFSVYPGIKFLNKFSLRNALRLSVVFGSASYLIFYFINENNIIYLIPLAIISVTLYRIFYWLPYHIDFAKFTDRFNRGKQFSTIGATSSIINGLIPALAGFLIVTYGFNLLFILATILFLLSGLFYVRIPKTNEKYTWSFKRTLKELISKENRSTTFSFFSLGMESVVGAIIWPIFIFQILKGDYIEVGIISAIIIVVTVILQLALGTFIDTNISKKSILKIGSLFYSLGWIAKIFIFTTFHIFVAGIYHGITSIFTKTPFVVLTYEIAADQGHYVDEFSVLREISLHIGKVVMVVVSIILSVFLPIQWTFLIAAIAAITLNGLHPVKIKI